MNNWMNYRLRLLKAMGIAPAVMGLALMGCDEATPMDATAELAMTSPLGPPMALQFTGVLDTGVMLDFDVTGAPPNSTVWLVFGNGLGQGLCPPILGGNCLGVTDARLMARATSDAAGNVTITAAVPHEIDANLDIHIQAVSLDGATGNAYLSNIHSDVTTTPVRDCGDHPWLDASTAFWFNTLACGPMPSSGVCPDYTTATPRMAERLYQYATGQPSFGALIELTCNETSVEDACCYGMEVDQLIAICHRR